VEEIPQPLVLHRLAEVQAVAPSRADLVQEEMLAPLGVLVPADKEITVELDHQDHSHLKHLMQVEAVVVLVLLVEML
jgi:hypothetical protein